MIGMKPANTFALVAVMFTAATLLRAEERMRTGLWEVSTKLDGQTTADMNSRCYTPAMVEAANVPARMLREATEKAVSKNGRCTLTNFKMDGNKISMTVACGADSTAYTSTYSGDAFETDVTSTEAGVKKVIKMKGRRTGNCP